MKKFLFLSVFFASFLFAAEIKYSPLIDQQILLVQKINDANISKNDLKSILHEQKLLYVEALEYIMSNKKEYLQEINLYDSEIFALEKIIKINKRYDNTYAILRDEVQKKSYQLLRSQNMMIQNILLSLDYTDSESFSEEINKYIVKNQEEVQALQSVDYSPVLALTEEFDTLTQAKENIRDFYALVDINVDVINNIYLFEKKMYRLNKYSKYNLIGTVVYINKFKYAKDINFMLENYGLSITKIVFILAVIIGVFLIRFFIYTLLYRYFQGIVSIAKYSNAILKSVKKALHLLFVLVGINLILFIYNDFISVDSICRFFNIAYIFVATFIFYRIISAIATVKIDEIESENKNIKREIINISLKIAYVVIFIIGFLIILHLGGIDLTAILSGLGIGGLAVALAAKDSLANFFGTLSIILSDTFSQGDWIEVDKQEGVVVEIGLRVTTLRTFDNALIAIPNATVANQDVKNWSKREIGRRIKMNIGIKYSSKSHNIKNAVEDIREMLCKHPGIATQNITQDYIFRTKTRLISKEDAAGIKNILLVYLDEFTPSNMTILIYCFSKSVVWEDWLETKEDVMHKIMEIFEKNSLEFALPSLSVYQENREK
ncbi:MAG: mechanosensitive ion channel [Sulfurimonas sp.]|nr:mechanosensitive ion channel [Sulfurimonas sp.]